MESETIRVLKGREEELTYRLQEVRAVLTLLGASPEDEPPADDDDGDDTARGASAPRGKARAGRPRGGRAGGKWAERLARLLADGPLTLAELADRAGARQQSFRGALMASPWFRQPTPRGPWELTEEGRAALRALPSANGSH